MSEFCVLYVELMWLYKELIIENKDGVLAFHCMALTGPVFLNSGYIHLMPCATRHISLAI